MRAGFAVGLEPDGAYLLEECRCFPLTVVNNSYRVQLREFTAEVRAECGGRLGLLEACVAAAGGDHEEGQDGEHASVTARPGGGHEEGGAEQYFIGDEAVDSSGRNLEAAAAEVVRQRRIVLAALRQAAARTFRSTVSFTSSIDDGTSTRLCKGLASACMAHSQPTFSRTVGAARDARSPSSHAANHGSASTCSTYLPLPHSTATGSRGTGLSRLLALCTACIGGK